MHGPAIRQARKPHACPKTSKREGIPLVEGALPELADGRMATRERGELARLRALLALGQGDASAAQARVEQMQSLGASLPRRTRIEALRSELAAARVAALRGDNETAVRALERASTV